MPRANARVLRPIFAIGAASHMTAAIIWLRLVVIVTRLASATAVSIRRTMIAPCSPAPTIRCQTATNTTNGQSRHTARAPARAKAVPGKQ